MLRVSWYAKRVEPRVIVLRKLRSRDKIEPTIVHIPVDELNGAAVSVNLLLVRIDESLEVLGRVLVE